MSENNIKCLNCGKSLTEKNANSDSDLPSFDDFIINWARCDDCYEMAHIAKDMKVDWKRVTEERICRMTSECPWSPSYSNDVYCPYD